MKSLVLAVVLAARARAGSRAAEPVTKVVDLLKELKGRLEGDGKAEQAVYDKFACWCENSTSEKAGTITATKSQITALGNTILQQKGTVATRTAEIKELTSDISDNEANQEKTTAVRQKENEAYLSEKAELEEATAALESATVILRDATTPSGASLRQGRSKVTGQAWQGALLKIGAVLRRLPPQRLEGKEQHLAALQRAAAEYTPQSMTIQGILQDMYSSFTANLQGLTSDEATRHKNYESLMATYQAELAKMQTTMLKKEDEKVEAETIMADGERDYSDAGRRLDADIEYFDATKASCVAKAEEWSARSALRQEEIAGISQALAILSSDEAKTLFGKAIQPGVATLLQLSSRRGSDPAARAAGALRAHAGAAGSLRLAQIAADLGGRGVGHFDEVVKAIDTMLTQLETEEHEDAAKVEECKGQYQELDSEAGDLAWKIKNNQAHQEKLGRIIAKATQEKYTVTADLVDAQDALDQLRQGRHDENELYLQAKADDEKAIQLLEQAKDALQQYFTKNSIELGPLQNFAQVGRGSADPMPDAKFADKAKRKVESKGIISLLTAIVEDLRAEIVSAGKAEEQAQLDHEKQLAAATKLEKELLASMANLAQTIAERQAEEVAEGEKLESNQGSHDSLLQMREDMKPSCDFHIDHQEERRRKRSIEAEGLRHAKEYLAGANAPTPSAASLIQVPQKASVRRIARAS